MDFQTSVGFMVAIIGLCLAVAGSGMTFLPSDHLIEPGSVGRKIRIALGWTLILSGFVLAVVAGVLLFCGKSQEAATQLVNPQSKLASSEYTPVPTPPTNKTTTYCQAVSIWFVEDGPEFNIFPDSNLEGQPAHLLEMKFHVEIFNKLNEEKLVDILYDFENTRLSTSWKIAEPSIEILSPEIKTQAPHGFLIPPKTHLSIYVHVFISTEDMHDKNFYKHLLLLTNKMKFSVRAKTDEGETCSASQSVDARDGFETNFRSNHMDITQTWGQ